MAKSRFLWMSALAAARRDAVSLPGGRLAACFRSISSAAEGHPWFCFSASALRWRGCRSLRSITGGSLRAGELLQREGVADVVERLVAGEAFGLVHAGPVLLVGGEHGVVPILVAQHFGNVLAPARVSRHGRVGDELLRYEVAVGAGGRLSVGAELRRIHFGEPHRAVGQPLAP